MVREKIALACKKAGRDPDSVVIVAVSKGRSIEEIREAVSYGLTDIGENRVQEALAKYNVLEGEFRKRGVRWHMVGHLQTNKAREAVKVFDLIHSVDSLRLAQAIDGESRKIDKIQRILLEVKTSPEESKFGFKPHDLKEAIEEISLLKNIAIEGLMTIAPPVDVSEDTRPYFRVLKEVRKELGLSLILSMGMTDDFEVAIEEGAEIVRIGRGIFEGVKV